MSENKYRKIWIEHFGEIPKDEYGITYEIHHIDRNRSNNDITNLMCVSLKEHFYIHFNAKEYSAAYGVMIRMKCIDDLPIGKSELASLAARTLPDSKKAFLRPDVRKKNLDSMKERINNGTFHLLSGEIQSRTNKRLVSEGRHVFQLDRVCKFCNKTGKGFGFHSKHNEYCELNPDRNKYLLKCHFCGKLSHPSIFVRYRGYMCSNFKGIGHCDKK